MYGADGSQTEHPEQGCYPGSDGWLNRFKNDGCDMLNIVGVVLSSSLACAGLVLSFWGQFRAWCPSSLRQMKHLRFSVFGCMHVAAVWPSLRQLAHFCSDFGR